MKTLDAPAYEKIRRWIYRNARPLDFALWQYHFENGSKQTVLSILSQYQNSDGGFGNGIEPSAWSSESTPYNAWFAVRILRRLDFTDATHPICRSLARYLENTQYQADFGWFFITPGRGWDHRAQENPFQSIGITANLSGFLLRCGDRQSGSYQMARDYAKMLIGKISSTEFGDMGIQGYCILLEDMERAGITDEYDYPQLCWRLHHVVREKIHDEANDFFMENPLMFVSSPRSQFYEENKRQVEAALDEIIGQLPASGIWDIPWNESSAISENWWRSFEATEKLLLLKRFERLVD